MLFERYFPNCSLSSWRYVNRMSWRASWHGQENCCCRFLSWDTVHVAENVSAMLPMLSFYYWWKRVRKLTTRKSAVVVKVAKRVERTKISLLSWGVITNQCRTNATTSILHSSLCSTSFIFVFPFGAQHRHCINGVFSEVDLQRKPHQILTDSVKEIRCQKRYEK